ncbi:MAG TPA: hypothetical protein VK574_20295 [Terracidiphilus sp.]|nr:hypothetical protein [Terracidiphilus sp.]
MKAATVIAVALAAFSSFPSPAQQQPEQQPQQSQSATAPGQQNAPASQPSAGSAQLKPVTGELVDKLDSKSAKQGDSVVVKTKEDLKFEGGADIPKGSKLVGHITNVQARSDGKENSQIAIQFDHAELKGGQNLAIESVIQSVSPAAGAGGAMDNSVPGSYSGSPSPQGAPGATSSSPGMSGSSSSMSSNTASSNTANNRPGIASNTTAQPGATDQTTNTGMPAPGSIVARSGNVAIRTTAVPGVLLANDINGLPFTNASGMLLGARRDIHLDGGTQMVVAIAAAPQGAGGGMSR